MGASYRFGAMLAYALALTCGACTTESTHVKDVWRAPGYSAEPMKNLIVFGARLKEPQRRAVEDGFVSALARYDVRATQSYKVLPTPFPKAEVARAMLQQSGFDGALVATLRSVSEREFETGTGGFWGGGYLGAGLSQPVVTEPVVKFETALWDTRGATRMVWATVTRTDNPSSSKNIAANLAKSVAPMLLGEGLVAPSPRENVSYGAHPALQ